MLTDKKIEVSIFFSLSSEITSSFFVYSQRIYEEIWAYWLFKEVHFPGGFPHSSNCLQCRRPGFNPLAGKIPWRREWQLTPVFLPEESHDRGTWWATVHGVTQSQTRDWNDLAQHNENSIQCYVVTCMGKKSKKERICVYVELTHFAARSRPTMLHSNSTAVKD